jgi:hypothetical protein
MPCQILAQRHGQKLSNRKSSAGVSPAKFPLKRFLAEGFCRRPAGETPALPTKKREVNFTPRFADSKNL